MTINDYIDQYNRSEINSYGDLLNQTNVPNLNREQQEIYDFLQQSDRNRLLRENHNLIE